MYDITTAEKGKRMVYIYKLLINGNYYSSEELLNIMRQEFSDISLRTVQRDIQDLREIEPLITRFKEGKHAFWKIDKRAQTVRQFFKITPNELLSLHVLKAHLKTFKNTIIDDDVNELIKKLEPYAPSDVYSKDSFFWDQNIGRFDYTQYDPIIRRIIKYISEEQPVMVEYDNLHEGKVKKYIVTLRKIFSYSGLLYVVAYTNRHDSHIALSIQNILKVEARANYNYKLPKFDFLKWTKNRFGVFQGPLKKVVLKIDSEYAHYFENRTWHQSQIITKQKDGSLIIELKVPLTPDFKAWILGWADAITILKPVELIKEVNYKVRKLLSNYE